MSLSPAVTRILAISGFPSSLKTRDIQTAFSDYENVNGGFKIKWRDDTSLLVVFADATIAKRAYLNMIAFPPAVLDSAIVRPYDGPDAQSVIQAVNARSQHHSNPSRSHNPRAASVSAITGPRSTSGSSVHPPRHNHLNGNGAAHISIPEHPSNGREPSPTLPSLPSHPTLNALISSTLGESALTHSDPAILATSLQHEPQGGGVRVGDPGKRMLGHALGVPRSHPGLGGGARSASGSPGSNGVDLSKSMNALTVAE